MIQRIQTLWLILAAGFIFLVFKFPFGNSTTGTIVTPQLTASNLLMFIMAILLGIIALAAIFFFKNRPTQKRLIWLGILLDLVFIVVMYFHMEGLKTGANQATFQVGAVFPILYIILLVMAFNGVRNDEKLIKSVDRLR